MSHYLTHSWHIQLDVIHVEEVVRGYIRIHSGGELVQGVESSELFSLVRLVCAVSHTLFCVTVCVSVLVIASDAYNCILTPLIYHHLPVET